MKIPTALEEMVAGLISDEKEKREEVEAVLGQIEELVSRFKADRIEAGIRERGALSSDGSVPPPEDPPAPVLSQAEKLKNFTAAFERRGMPPERAQDAAEEALGMRDGTR
jgi:hypothetical protein